MCGIIGIITKDKKVSYELFNSLLDLQHRGQDTAGIFTTDQDKAYMYKSKGLVSEVFCESNLKELKGNMGIGQVRYPTTKGKQDAQPFYADMSGIGLAHNGNLYNDSLIRDQLKEKRIYCDSDCDAETILKVFAYYFNQETGSVIEKCFACAKKTMSVLNGSYSVVSVIRDEGMFIFRDPSGIRPFCMGKKYKDNEVQCYAFSSETIAIENMVDSFEWIKPGEGIFIDKNLSITRHIITQKKKQHCMFEWVYFSRATSIIEGMSVNHVRGNLGKKLAELYHASPLFDRLSQNHHKIIVAPIPETARPASVVFARHISHEHKDVIEKNRFIGRIFIKPNETLREHEISSNVKAIEEVIKDKIVFLVDDSIVRGTTSRGIVQKLKSKGAKEVHFFSTCPPLINPCHYGVDLPTRKELIAYGKQLKEIEDYIGADSITYMSIEKLVDAIGLPQKDLCLACLNGNYPTDLFQREVRL